MPTTREYRSSAKTSTCCCRCPTIRSAIRWPARWRGSRRANASGGRTQGVGVRFPHDEKTRLLKPKIEETAGHQPAIGQAHADHLSAAARRGPVASATLRRMFVDSHCHLSFPELRSQLDRHPCAEMADAQVSTVRSASARRSRSSTACTRSRLRTTTSGPASACTPTTKRQPSRRQDDLIAPAGLPQGGGDRRDRPRLLPAERPQRRRHGSGSASASAFTSALRVASGKPLVIHTRSASADTLDVLREERGAWRRRPGGVFHCFTETLDVARAALDLGFCISFSGILTFRNADDLREVARVRAAGPLPDRDRQPVPRAGAVSRQDQHARRYVPWVARRLAEIKGVEVSEVAEVTSRNFERLFGLTAAEADVPRTSGSA